MNARPIPTVTAFRRSPDGGRGLARDMRVRWALEEVGQRYDIRPVSFAAMKQPAHLTLQPFGQIPTFEEGALTLFETGAIVLHIARTRTGLLPDDADAQARAIMWMFAAVGTIEPPIVEREAVIYFEHGESWFAQRLRAVEERIRGRLADLSRSLGEADWLDGGFSAGDLMMVDVLRRLGGSDLLDGHPNLSAYVVRGEARPAFRRAFDAQRAFFLAAAP
ncbi:MAG TPA: glutathione S-transferase family protein [Amaricoccus sp.]|uniref:glutathione S-transferase family protein n=1 Tax=Amaricoccus sp. TaxID=1872485 RepID=UPI002BB624B5|nr:glutathione S-transferase family protein [Amaricoccus sp.]HMQ93201.1 glutathione S-transferase family protein [Amaricoccus sp.]HMR54318.1 glutathione S-transferase family protein [Amaricoccus sp.]HMR60463.1 glutathione S-transferase family protein [Amaricoccus sp.]HMU01309.1 glutathione S-transferase family protein [Amaricoccus sp.]